MADAGNSRNRQEYMTPIQQVVGVPWRNNDFGETHPKTRTLVTVEYTTVSTSPAMARRERRAFPGGRTMIGASSPLSLAVLM